MDNFNPSVTTMPYGIIEFYYLFISLYKPTLSYRNSCLEKSGQRPSLKTNIILNIFPITLTKKNISENRFGRFSR